MTSIPDVLASIAFERTRQNNKWGEQNHPDGTGDDLFQESSEDAKSATDIAATRGTLTWQLILEEEVLEAFAESDPIALREELVQVAAVAVAWIEAIDRRTNG